MYSLFSEVKFWTWKNDVEIRNTDFGAFRYYDKKEIDECPYLEGKKSYSYQRGTAFVLQNKRPFKLRDNLKELEHQLATSKVVYNAWKNDNILTIILSTGLIITIGVNVTTKDIYKITFDRFLVGKLLSENVCDVLSTETHLVVSYNENQLTIVNYTKPRAKSNVPQKLNKLEPRVQQADLCGPSGRRLERHLGVNKSGDMILTWWHSTRNEVYPWSPLVKDEDRANIHVYSLDGTRIELVCFYRTEFDLISVNFSRLKAYSVWLIEQKVSKKGEVVIEYSSHEVVKKSFRKISVTSIPLQTQICCHSISPDEEKLALGCIDGSLVLFDEPKGMTRLVKTAFIPNLVSWHSDGALIIIANERSRFQFFDFALSCIRVQLLSEDVAPSIILDLATYFKSQPTLLNMKWNKKSDLTSYADRCVPNDGLLLLVFESGPLAVLKLIGGGGLMNDVQFSGLTPDVIIRQYILWHQSDKALNLLLCLNWNTNGSTCLAALYHIANYIFREPFAPEKELILETALGSFYSPIRPLTSASENEFGNQVHDLTRRFFYHLLRYRLYEKAYCLAIDLGNSDLFVDLYHCAKILKDDEMAVACKTKFEELSSMSDSSSHSCVSHSSCSCTDSSTENDETAEAILPPLPQVSVKKAKASKVPPLPDLNRHNKLRGSSFFNCNSAYVPADPLNGLPHDGNLGTFPNLPKRLESETASTSFQEVYPSVLNRPTKFSDLSMTPTSIFSHPYEKRTSFSGEDSRSLNFTPIESVPQKCADLKAPKVPMALQPRTTGINLFEGICEALPLSPSDGQNDYVNKTIVQNRYDPTFNNSEPLRFQATQVPRSHQVYGSNLYACNAFVPSLQYSSLEPLMSASVPQSVFRPINNGEKPRLRTHQPVNPEYYLPRNLNVKLESYASPMKTYGHTDNLLLQRPLQFVPGVQSKPVMRPLSSAKQKVKFSDTVTQIVLPDISKMCIEDETWISREKVKNNRTVKPTIAAAANRNHQPLAQHETHNYTTPTNRQPRNDEEENSTSIKVIHFGVV